MPQQDVITQLIYEDLKYRQFIDGLEQLDIVLEYYPDFPIIIARLLGIPRGQIDDAWIETYSNYIELSRDCSYHNSKELMQVATRLHQRLLEFE